MKWSDNTTTMAVLTSMRSTQRQANAGGRLTAVRDVKVNVDSLAQREDHRHEDDDVDSIVLHVEPHSRHSPFIILSVRRRFCYCS